MKILSIDKIDLIHTCQLVRFWSLGDNGLLPDLHSCVLDTKPVNNMFVVLIQTEQLFFREEYGGLRSKRNLDFMSQSS